DPYVYYKVVRTYVGDGMWKITMAFLRAQKAALREAQAQIKKLQDEVAAVHAVMKSKDEAVAQREHDSSHINVLGIDFLKSVFLSTVGIIILALLVLLGLLVARVKWVQSSMRE